MDEGGGVCDRKSKLIQDGPSFRCGATISVGHRLAGKRRSARRLRSAGKGGSWGGGEKSAYASVKIKASQVLEEG